MFTILFLGLLVAGGVGWAMSRGRTDGAEAVRTARPSARRRRSGHQSRPTNRPGFRTRPRSNSSRSDVMSASAVKNGLLTWDV